MGAWSRSAALLPGGLGLKGGVLWSDGTAAWKCPFVRAGMSCWLCHLMTSLPRRWSGTCSAPCACCGVAFAPQPWRWPASGPPGVRAPGPSGDRERARCAGGQGGYFVRLNTPGFLSIRKHRDTVSREYVHLIKQETLRKNYVKI